MTPLGDVAVVSTGYPFRTKVETEEGGDILVLQIKDIDVVEGGARTGSIMIRGDDGRYDKYFLQEGDLLFQARGSRHPVTIVERGIRRIAAAGVHVIRPVRERVTSGYLAWFLNHPHSQARLTKDVARGSYIPFISKAELELFAIVVPPVEVQSQIVEVERLRRRESELNRQLEELKQRAVDSATWAAAISSTKVSHE